jgi:tetratricopeptide (TPR) repeat protein
MTSAQSSAPPCPADRPVDEFIAEIRAQSKQKARNKNPLPDDICVFGWCGRAKRPHSNKPQPPKEISDTQQPSAGDGPGDYSSSKKPDAKCDRAMEVALSAAHHVEVGDSYFEEKKYRAALLRYTDALAEKPGDAAIHVRLGRVLERLNEIGKAIEHYQEAQKLGGPAKWSEEATAALVRLRPSGT